MTLIEAVQAVLAAWHAGEADIEPSAMGSLVPALRDLEASISEASAGPAMPPSPLTVDLPGSFGDKSMVWTQITLRAPTLDDLLKASAVPGSSSADQTKKLIAEVTGMPQATVGQLPAWFVQKIDQYFDGFNRAPPLHPTLGP